MNKKRRFLSGIILILIFLNAFGSNNILQGTRTSPRGALNEVTDFVDQVSDLHSPSDVGTHSSFAAEQSAPDVSYDTLTEANLGSAATNYNDYVDQQSVQYAPSDTGTHSSFVEMQDEDVVYDTLTEGSEVTSTQVAYQSAGNGIAGVGTTLSVPFPASPSTGDLFLCQIVILGTTVSPSSMYGFSSLLGAYTMGGSDGRVWIYYKYSNGSETGNALLTFSAAATAGAFARTYSFRYAHQTIGSAYEAVNWETSTGATISDVGVTTTGTKELAVNFVSVGEDANTYTDFTGETGGDWTESVAQFSNAAGNDGTLQIQCAAMASAGTVNGGSYAMGASDPAGVLGLALKPATSTNYDMDLEVCWTTAPYSETNEELCILGSTQGAEAMRVDVYSGSWTNLIADLAAGWNNISVSSYLTGSNLTIRFTDTADESTLADTWQVDAVKLHCWTDATFDYELDLEVGWTAIANYSAEYEELCIYGGTQDAEALKVDVWSGSWTNVITDLATGWNNVSIKAYLSAATFEIRFVDADKTSESSQSTWEIDSVLIHTWSTAPTYDTLTESADPLELGATETININVYDASTVSSVYLEFDGVNHTMTYISGNNWRYTTWTPTSVGVQTYAIHMIDNYGCASTTGDQTLTVQDTTAPTISNVVESADPLELGATETIRCNVTDQSSLALVYLEFDGANHSMSVFGGTGWRYDAWTPTSVGVKSYKIWANDTSGNVAQSSGSITVQDTTAPAISNVQESADPLELGATESIECDVTDQSSLYFVRLEFEGANHSMSFVSGNHWQYTSWEPTSTGVKNYVIWANDTSGNVAQFSDSITVQDTTNPIISNVQESADPLELGATESIQCDITDESGMYFVRLEFEGANHTMSFVSGITWEYTSWTPTSVGIKPYTIWANDTSGNIASYAGSITVQDTTNPVINNVQESADPLELGATETIQCDILDESSMYLVYLEFEGSNHSMSFVSGITWEYTSWTPTSVGVKNYVIWANDSHGNIAQSSGSITVQDTVAPIISNVIESADPLPFGNTETIQCDISDESSLYFVYLEFEGSNHSMSFVSGITWEYASWIPDTVGIKPYTIWTNDTSGNIASYNGDIEVTSVDSTPPNWNNLVEISNPLEFGYNITLRINVTDAMGINQVLLEFDVTNHTMNHVSGDMWEYTNWHPVSCGTKYYTIHLEDTSHNWNSTGEQNFNVQDTVAPIISNVIEGADPLELGATETIQCDILDESSMYLVYLEFEGSNHSMSFVSGITWEYASWIPSTVGNKPYTIWANDTSGNIVSYSGSITVEDTTAPVINNVQESADPLEIGGTEIIICSVMDYSPLDFVYFEFEGTNHSMINIGGTLWQYSNWTPASVGNYPYTIWANDSNGYIASYSDSVDVTTVHETPGKTPGETPDRKEIWLILLFITIAVVISIAVYLQMSEKHKSRKYKSPKYKSPKIKSPKYKSPRMKSPKFKLPKIKSPKYKSPRMKSPKFKLPRLKSPKYKPPKNG